MSDEPKPLAPDLRGVDAGPLSEWIHLRRHGAFGDADLMQVKDVEKAARPFIEAAIAAKDAEIAALRADAERYRWLRDTNNNTEIRSNSEHLEPLQVPIIYIGHPEEHWTLDCFASAPVGDGFDAAIDAAIDAAREAG